MPTQVRGYDHRERWDMMGCCGAGERATGRKVAEQSSRLEWENQTSAEILPHESPIQRNLVDEGLIFPVGDIQNILFSLLEDSAYYSQFPVAQYVQYAIDLAVSDAS